MTRAPLTFLNYFLLEDRYQWNPGPRITEDPYVADDGLVVVHAVEERRRSIQEFRKGRIQNPKFVSDPSRSRLVPDVMRGDQRLGSCLSQRSGDPMPNYAAFLCDPLQCVFEQIRPVAEMAISMAQLESILPIRRAWLWCGNWRHLAARLTQAPGVKQGTKVALKLRSRLGVDLGETEVTKVWQGWSHKAIVSHSRSALGLPETGASPQYVCQVGSWGMPRTVSRSKANSRAVADLDRWALLGTREPRTCRSREASTPVTRQPWGGDGSGEECDKPGRGA
jgi:hypothetical protein